MKKSKQYIGNGAAGFTMVELMIALMLTGFVVAMISSAYFTQNASSREQQMIGEMQQNMRAAMFFMERDLMMAGYDADVDDTAVNPTFTNAQSNTVTFEYNADDDGVDNDGVDGVDNPDEVETITYRLFDSAADADLLNDDLQRQGGGNAIAGNIDFLEFLYTQADGTQSTAVTGQANLNRIVSVGVSMVIRTEDETHRSQQRSYTMLSGAAWMSPADGFVRQIVKNTVQCRNRLMENQL